MMICYDSTIICSSLTLYIWSNKQTCELDNRLDKNYTLEFDLFIVNTARNKISATSAVQNQPPSSAQNQPPSSACALAIEACSAAKHLLLTLHTVKPRLPTTLSNVPRTPSPGKSKSSKPTWAVYVQTCSKTNSPTFSVVLPPAVQ